MSFTSGKQQHWKIARDKNGQRVIENSAHAFSMKGGAKIFGSLHDCDCVTFMAAQTKNAN